MSEVDIRKSLLIIVTYNSYLQLPDLVDSIRKFDRDDPGNYVVVVENSADLRVREYIVANHNSEKVLVEVAPRNEGFSHGVNLGYQSALNLWGGFDFVVLLNPDVISAGPTVCELVNRAAGHPSEVGVWGAVLTDPAGKLDRGCARRVWNLRRLFSHLVGYDNLVKVLRTAPRNLSEYEIQGNQSELAMVSGALMCIDSGLFGAGLNTLLPMYLEDQEICMRSLAEGHLIMLYPDLVAVHAGGVSRKSLTDHDRALRIMELVEAPVQCMARLQGYSALSLRLTVFLGGISRIVAAFLAASFKVLLRRGGSNQVAWMLEQQRLGLWFALWAIKGAIHDEEVSLSDYFLEYAPRR